MAIRNPVSSFLSKKNWVMPVLFGTMCACLLTLIVLITIRTLQNTHPSNAFTIGAELCAMVVAIMMAISILPSYKRHSRYNFLFFTTLTFGCLALFFDSWEILYDRDPAYSTVNLVASVFAFSNASLYTFFFWLYACRVLKCQSRTFEVFKIIAAVLLGVSIVLPYVNLFYPLYFQITESGTYARVLPGWFFSQLYPAYLLISSGVLIIMSKVKLKDKLLIMTFAVLPLGLTLLSGYLNPPGDHPTIQVEYTAMMVSLVLIYAFLFSDNEKSLYSKSKELGIATSIQQNMLPNIFPAFPEREDFDVYASMAPAKEVGGDFYDFFLVDETHLGLVIADVSDKGIPAALFMMACKIMIQNYAMQGKSPAEVISLANKQICGNNKEGMFVTVWLGILDLSNGKLTVCNAGHENPVFKKPNGHFEIYKDKHSFVVGGDETTVFREYVFQLEKGSKIFVYTDGVPEAYNGSTRFDVGRMVQTLIDSENLPPKEIIGNMKKAIEAFIGKQDQFDDTTMLCFEYKGPIESK